MPEAIEWMPWWLFGLLCAFLGYGVVMVGVVMRTSADRRALRRHARGRFR